jgi:hypothetical protein
VLGLVFTGQTNGGPLTTYIWIGYALGLLFAAMYVAVNLAAMGYYLTERRDELNVLKHVVVPIIGVILLIPAFLGVLGGLTIPILDIKLDPLAAPYSFVPPLVAIWMVVGVVLYFFLRNRNAETVERMGDVFGEA